MYGRTRCAAFMGHKIILSKMSQVGRQAGQSLQGDPMRGYLANLDVDDYKGLFRPQLPTSMRGADFLGTYGPTIDQATSVDPATDYHVQAATDHHVFEARRVRQFVEFIREAARHPHGTRQQGQALDKAGHLMYASHLSYSNCAMLGAPECDLLVDLVRRHEPAGLYGAKITGGGSGGTVAILADISPKADEAVARIMRRYQEQTGHVPEAFMGSSDGAWEVGTKVVA
jgi:L-arabinokinase